MLRGISRRISATEGEKDYWQCHGRVDQQTDAHRHEAVAQIPDNPGATARHLASEEGEDPDRRQFDDGQGQRLDHFEHAVHQPLYGVHVGSVEARQEEPEEKGKDNHRQDIARGHRGNDVVRHHSCQELRQRRGCRREALRQASGVGKIEVSPGLDDIDEDHADGDRESCGNRVVEDGANTHATDRAGAAEAGDTAHERGEDERNDDHFEQPEEEVAEKADAFSGRRSQPAKCDTDHEGEEHLPVELEVPGFRVLIVNVGHQSSVGRRG
jgi:hypothetical protein